MDLKLLQLWTELVETKCQLEAKLDNVSVENVLLRESLLEASFSHYDCENYPKYRYVFTESYSSSTALKKPEMLKRFFTVDELKAFVDKKVDELGLPVYKSNKEE